MTEPITDAHVTRAMVVYGGSFVSALGKLWPLADDNNRARLKAAFPEYWEQYHKLAVLQQERSGRAR